MEYSFFHDITIVKDMNTDFAPHLVIFSLSFLNSNVSCLTQQLLENIGLALPTLSTIYELSYHIQYYKDTTFEVLTQE